MTAIQFEEAEPGRWAWILDEVREQELFRWASVALTLGIWLYFALPVEPAIVVCAVFAVAGLLLFRMGKTGRLAAALLAGFILAKARAEFIGTPPLDRSIVAAKVTGVIEDIEQRGANRARMRIRVEAIEGVDTAHQPYRLILSLRGRAELPSVGSRVVARTMLTPLPLPVMPGGFDYGRSLWFEGIGGTGRVIGDLTIETRIPTWRESFRAALHSLRIAIGARIAAAVPRDLSGFAEAIITGERGAIPKHVNDSLQVSGLAHVLSISGLHMSLVAGGVFWIVRAVLAFFPGLALRRPIKKWAAAAALGAGLFYMLLAGAGVATQRSYIMLAIMFLAVLLDRPAITLRNLSLAALFILVLEPEAAVTASFQMSFLAVAGLVALSEAVAIWRQSRAERRTTGVLMRAIEMASWAIFISAATGLVAGTLSSIPAVYHFGRFAPLSLLANLLALPVISLVVMPAAILAVLAMPVGLEAGPLWVLGEGLRLVMAISDWVAGLPGARLNVAAPPAMATVIVAAGALWLCFWRGHLRAAGLAIAALGLLLASGPTRPDVIIEETAANVAVRGSGGQLALADPRKGRFAAEKWLIADGDTVKPAEAARRPGWICDGAVCRAGAGGKRIVFLRNGVEPSRHCAKADILIAAMPLRGACRSVALRIDRFAVWRNGTHALRITNAGITVETARAKQGARPWTIKRKARLIAGVVPPLSKAP